MAIEPSWLALFLVFGRRCMAHDRAMTLLGRDANVVDVIVKEYNLKSIRNTMGYRTGLTPHTKLWRCRCLSATQVSYSRTTGSHLLRFALDGHGLEQLGNVIFFSNLFGVLWSSSLSTIWVPQCDRMIRKEISRLLLIKSQIEIFPKAPERSKEQHTRASA